MRTTVTLDDDVAARLRAETSKSGRTFSQTLNEILRLGLKARREIKRPKPFVVRPRSLGQRPDLDYDRIGKLLEQVEGPTHQ